ncbi:RHS repeat-associated core domain-containing protein [Paenibacillus motobuensis]|uniref:Uncharacterized protein n=1 Tax=Paenibacillus motobuensis TaxID=295324 RepID=A0ABN0YFU3_9BACL
MNIKKILIFINVLITLLICSYLYEDNVSSAASSIVLEQGNSIQITNTNDEKVEIMIDGQVDYVLYDNNQKIVNYKKNRSNFKEVILNGYKLHVTNTGNHNVNIKSSNYNSKYMAIDSNDISSNLEFKTLSEPALISTIIKPNAAIEFTYNNDIGNSIFVYGSLLHASYSRYGAEGRIIIDDNELIGLNAYSRNIVKNIGSNDIELDAPGMYVDNFTPYHNPVLEYKWVEPNQSVKIEYSGEGELNFSNDFYNEWYSEFDVASYPFTNSGKVRVVSKGTVKEVEKGRHIITNRDVGQYLLCPSETCDLDYYEKPAISEIFIEPGESVSLIRYNDAVYSNISLQDSKLRGATVNFSKYDQDGFPLKYGRNNTSYDFDFLKSYSTVITNVGNKALRIEVPYEIYQISRTENPALRIMKLEPGQSIIFNQPYDDIYILGKYVIAYYGPDNISKGFTVSSNYLYKNNFTNWQVVENIDQKAYEIYGAYNTFDPILYTYPALKETSLYPGGVIEINNPYIEKFDSISTNGNYDVEVWAYDKFEDKWKWQKHPLDLSPTYRLIRNVGNTKVVYRWAYHASINGGIISSGPSKISGVGGKEGISKLDPLKINECSAVADPVDTASGAQVIDRFFLNTKCSVPIRLHLNHNSLLLNEGPLGKGWNHEFETKLNFVADNNIELLWNSNRKNLFVLSGTHYVSNDLSTIHDKLIKHNDGTYTLKRKDQTIYLFNKEGKLLSITYSNGNELKMKYGDNGEIYQVIDPISGQELTFYYNEKGKISKVSDSMNRAVTFVYDNNKNLIEIFNENNEKTSYTYTPQGALLTGVNDEGVQLFSNEYDEHGRVVKQTDAQGNTTVFRYIEENNKVTTVVKKRDNGERTLIHNQFYQLTEIQDELGNKYHFTYDSKGNQISSIDPLGNETLMAYDERGNLTSLTDANGFVTKMTYDDRNNLLTKTDALGNITSYTYDGLNNLLSVTDPLGAVIRWTYNNENLPISKTNAAGAITTYSYISGRLSSITDPLGAVTSYEYDLAGRLVKATDPSGNVTILEYDPRGNIIRLTDKLGNIYNFSYNSSGDLLSTTDPLGNVTAYTYNGNGLQTANTDSANQMTKYEYDPEDRLIKVTDPLLQSISYRYDLAGRIISYTDAKGSTSLMEYDSKGQLISTTNAEGYQISYEYDPVGQLIREIDSDNNKTVRSYNGIGQLVSMMNAQGDTTTYSYDANGNLISITDPLGNVSAFSYNVIGDLIKKTDALGKETNFEYDVNGRLVKSIDASGNTTQYKYDLQGNMIMLTDPMGHSYSFEYDANGNLISATDAKGKVIYTTQYDSLSRPIQVTDILGNTTTKTYDSLSRLTSVLNPKGQKNEYSYDELSRLNLVIDPVKGVSKQFYDENDQITSIIDPNGNEQFFSYNKLGNILSETNSTGSSLHYSYNQKGLITGQNNARGQESNIEYDSLGRIISIMNTEEHIFYSYDKNGNLLKIQGNEGDILRKYDELNRVVSYTDVYGNTVKYSYDQIGNLSQLMYPDGKVVSYTYNKNGLMESVTDWLGRLTTYLYDENSRLIKTTRSNGTVETRAYDDKGQLIEIKDINSTGDIIIYDKYAYDSSGLVEREDKSNSFEPNLSNELTMTYGPDNRLMTYNDEEISYDADGNMTMGPLQGFMQDFIYDSKNRLTNTGQFQYTYDSANQRIAISTSEETTRFVINPESYYSQLLMETDESGKVKTYYVYGLGLISREDANGAYQTYHYDRRGSTVALTDEQGNITDQYTYDSYGELLHREGDTKNRFLYSGKYGVMTDDTGLYYMRARYYNPDIKRFINRDVLVGDISDGQSLNRYAYVNGNPISYVDPFGLSRDGDSYDNFIENTVVSLAESLYYGTIGTFEAIINYEDTIRGIQSSIENFNLNDATNSVIQYVTNFACGDSETQAKMTGELLSNFVGIGVVSKVGKFIPSGSIKKLVTKFIKDESGSIGPFWGKGNALSTSQLGLKDGMKMKTNDVLENAEKFLGQGYKEMGNGRFVSADWTRVVRMGDNDILGKHGGGPHMNFETLVPNPSKPGKMKVDQNLHIYLED